MRTVAIALAILVAARAAHAEERDPVTAKPVETFDPVQLLGPPQHKARLIINPRTRPVIYLDGTRRLPAPMTIELRPTRKPVACKRLPDGATCRITY